MKWGMQAMTSHRLYCNRSILLQNLRQYGWISIIYLLALLVILPLNIMGKNTEIRASIISLFEVNGSVQGVMILIFPVLAGIFILRYIQSNPQSILVHSLPLRRQHILSTNMISGAILLLVPIWIVTFFIAILSSVTTLYYDFSGLIILEWGLAVSVFSLFMFTFTVFVGVCIGQSILQGIVTYAFLILPALMGALINEHLSFYLKGYYIPDVINEPEISPFLYMANLERTVPDFTVLLIYCGLTVLFAALSFGLYKLRQVENATQAIAFRFLKPVFRIVMMLGAALIMGEYVALQWTSFISVWTVLGCILGGLVGYILAEMIILKTWLVPFRIMSKGFLVYGTITALLLYVPVASWNGYENNIPSLEKIDTVSIGNPYFYRVNEIDDVTKRYSNEITYINAIHQLHGKVIETNYPIPTRRYGAREYEMLSIRYKLKDGGELVRNYNLPISKFKEELLAIYNTNTYKYNNNQLFRLDYNFSSIRLESEFIPERMIVISDPQEMEQFKALLKEEILAKPATVLKENRFVSVARIRMSIKNDDNIQWSGDIEPGFEKIRAWLKEKGLTERIELTPEQIESADISLVPLKPAGTGYFHRDDVEQRMENTQKISIEDKQIISDILNHSSHVIESKGEQIFCAALKLKSGQVVYTMVREKDASTALIGLFK
jgi:ABC-2 type transport system permease protein